MSRYGFIHDKLDIKLLILYIMSRVATPIDFATLTDLAMCDDGVDYFQFAEAVSELTASDHLLEEDGKYSITEKGRRNGADCESSLSVAIRRKCDLRLARVNPQLRRSEQVHSGVYPRLDGSFTLHLSLDDETGNLFSLDLLCATKKQAEVLAQRFQRHPEDIYNGILSTMLTEYEDEK